MAEPSSINGYLQGAYDEASQARSGVGFYGWSDSWQNYVVNKALADYEYAHNREMWDLQNEYNSPAAQMARFKEAGLNPMLIYQQGNPGNAQAAVQYRAPNLQFGTHGDKQKQLMTAMQGMQMIVGSVSNLAENVAKMYDAGLNIQLKKNQLVESDMYTNLLNKYMHGQNADLSNMPGGVNNAMPFLAEKLNPLSPRFDIQAYLTFSKFGGLPNYISNYQTADLQRQLLGFKTAYQKYYNENLLPKFNEFQAGKISLQDLEKQMSEYRKDTMTMIPAEVRGILEPLIDWLSPFFKFIFKKSSGSFSHSVNQ